VSDLPADRVLRTVREDLRNPEVLYLGAEFGLFYTNDGGGHWISLQNNMPNVAVNDLTIHPRDNDLILGTHGRGIWILDNITALQELTPEVLASEAHLFSVQPAAMIRYAGEKGHAGDMIFRGENPSRGAVIDYYLQDQHDEGGVSLTVHDSDGEQVAEVDVLPEGGVHRVTWNLRHSSAPMPLGGDRSDNVAGIPVAPGEYTVRLQLAGDVYEQGVDVSDDPRVDISAAERREWRDALWAVDRVLREQAVQTAAVNEAKSRLDAMSESDRSRQRALVDAVDRLQPMLREIRRRLIGLYSRLQGWAGAPTGDQRSQMEYLESWVERLGPRVERVAATQR
jgi:hypothetical protein